MYYIRNIQRNTVLCYKDGARIAYATEQTAQPHVEFAAHMTNEPHDVIAVAGPFMPLERSIAPWLTRK